VTAKVSVIDEIA